MKRYPHYIIGVARNLRKRATPAEKLLWNELHNQKLRGLKFRRQHHVGRFILDFYCAELRLAVELEGSIHDTADQTEYDGHRFAYLEANDIKILRIKNEEVLNDMENVLKRIAAF